MITKKCGSARYSHKEVSLCETSCMHPKNQNKQYCVKYIYIMAGFLFSQPEIKFISKNRIYIEFFLTNKL